MPLYELYNVYMTLESELIFNDNNQLVCIYKNGENRIESIKLLFKQWRKKKGKGN